MSEKMLVTQALDERDLLAKKINDKIAIASFVDTKKCNEEKVMSNRISREEFEKKAKSAYQQIMDLILRFQKIDEAIVESNAKTMIHTPSGDYTVASALSLRSRLKETGRYEGGGGFEKLLSIKLKQDLDAQWVFVQKKNQELETTAENMRLSILGKDSKGKDDKPLEVVNEYIRTNTTELIDPLNAEKKLNEICEWITTTLSELDTQIKVSNATTFIEI